jgi:type VI secretion system protein ImpB
MPPKAELPEERVMISYELDDGGALKKVILPFKTIITGDFSNGTGKDRSVSLEQRQIRDINEESLDKHMKDMKIEANVTVPNYAGQEGDEMNVQVPIDSMKSFSPDSVVQQVPMLRNLLKIREQLNEISSRAANEKNLLLQIEKLRSNPQARKRLEDYKVPEI